MNSIWKFFIPSIFVAILILLSSYSQFYYIFLFLLAGNVFNWIWGEFNQNELAATLAYFYNPKNAIFLKSINAIFLIFFIIWGIYFVDTSNYTLSKLIGFSLTVGLFTGCFVVTLGHDLLHSKSKFLNILSTLLFTASCIPHFATEHLCGHHRQIGLKQDPTTAKLNENFYTYFINVTFENLKTNFVIPYGLPNYFRKKIIRANFLMLVLLFMVWFIIGIITSS